MKLRTIYLSLYEYPDSIAGPFSFETRCLCNYVQRAAQKMKIETNGFNSIVIRGVPSLQHGPKIVSVKSLFVPFVPDLQRYTNESDAQKQDYFIEVLTEGLHNAGKFHPLPLSDLLSVVDEFRNGKYFNRWVHQSKTLRRHKFRAELQCELSMNRFSLMLQISQNDEIKLTKKILETKPDEICFHYQFKDLVVENEELVVTKRRGGELFRLPITKFINCK